MNLPEVPQLGRALFIVSLFALLLPRAAHGQRQEFLKTELPPQIVPFYGEVAAFKPATSSSKNARVDIDLAFLIKTSKVENVLVVPYDKENWYEPVSIKLNGKKLQSEFPLNRNILVILDLG